MDHDVLERIFDGSIKPRDVKLSHLENITKNFCKERIIGEGGFGIVYKGVLRNGEVAVKRIKNNQTMDETQFRREVNSLLNVNHANIVRFLGFCSHTEHKAVDYKGSGEYIYAEDRERILCFEYINNGSLEKYIADELRGLPWDTRYFIIKGICEGLHYLHMKKHIIHMDLKPANILIDNNMVAKITDFGLSRMEKNAETKSRARVSSLRYTAPEFIDSGKMSVKYDVYSLGVIIIELLTGHKSIPDSNNVLRRWRHRLRKSGNEIPFRYQQIAKLIEIGLNCQEKDPYKRPFISDIICAINELERLNRQISNAYESTVGQISTYPEDDMLGIEPLELHFPFELNTQIACSLELTNETNASIAFSIQTSIPLPYCIEPNKDIVAPRSKYSVNITLQPIDKAPQDKLTGDFIVRSTKVIDCLKSEDITEDIFNIERGKLVDEVNLTVTYKAKVPQVDVSLGSLIISDTKNLNGPQESIVPPTEAEPKISASTFDDVIQLHPPELCFTLVPDKRVLSSIKIINITDSYVSFAFSFPKKNIANYYRLNIGPSILPPRSTQPITLMRAEKEDAAEGMEFNDSVRVWYAIVAEDIEASDLNWQDYSEWKDSPVVLTKAIPCTSNELIRFDPPELTVPFTTNKASLFTVNIVNCTDCGVGFRNALSLVTNVGWYCIYPVGGVMPPRSTQRLVVKWVPKKKEQEDMQCEDKFFLWSSLVSEGVEVSDLDGCFTPEGCTELPIVHTKAIPCTSNELIQFDPPQLTLPFKPKNLLLFTINIVNSTDCYVGFAKAFDRERNVGRYYISPHGGVMPPRSTQRLMVKCLPRKNEQEGMQCEEKLILWSTLVTEGVELRDLYVYARQEGLREFPIVYNKSSLCTSDELIQLDPPQLSFPFLPNKRVSMLRKFKIVNVTDHIVGYCAWCRADCSALYTMEPRSGILQPQSMQAIKVRRNLKEMVTEDVPYKDMIFVWNGIVTEGVVVSDVDKCANDGDKELPIIFTQPGEGTST